MDTSSTYLEISFDQRDEAIARGYKRRYFFPHQAFFIPKCGPDGFKQATRMCGKADLNSCWEIVLYAISPAIDEFPRELFFDPDIIYHEQQFGRVGQIATVNLFINDDCLYSMSHLSDLVQRISRRRNLKTRVERVFAGWNFMLWNAMLNFARGRGLKHVYSPTADHAMTHTDKKRTVQWELFDRIYNRDVQRLFDPLKQGNFWRVDLAKNEHRIIQGAQKKDSPPKEKTICICHDIERGIGHIDVDPLFAKHANNTAPRHLSQMLTIEKELNVKTSYNVVGSFLEEIKELISSGEHCLAFHSYDHKVRSRPRSRVQKILNWYWEFRHPRQVNRCRQVDRRLKGYRPPRSHITSELKATNLCHHNFEWLASSVSSLKIKRPELKNCIVYIPVLFDDFPLYKREMDYCAWENKALDQVAASDFIAFGLHDCYGEFWLPYYHQFLEKLSGMGHLKTFKEVANEVTLASSDVSLTKGVGCP